MSRTWGREATADSPGLLGISLEASPTFLSSFLPYSLWRLLHFRQQSARAVGHQRPPGQPGTLSSPRPAEHQDGDGGLWGCLHCGHRGRLISGHHGGRQGCGQAHGHSAVLTFGTAEPRDGARMVTQEEGCSLSRVLLLFPSLGFSLAEGEVYSWGKGARGRLGRRDEDAGLPRPVQLDETHPYTVTSVSCCHGNTLLAVRRELF